MKKTNLVVLFAVIPAFILGCSNDSGDSPSDNSDDAMSQVQDSGDAGMTEQNAIDSDDQAHDSEESAHDAESGGHDAQEQAHDSTPHGHDTDVPSAEDAAKLAHDATPHSHDSVAGQPGTAADVGRTVEVVMDDNMRFTPDQFSFAAGETIRISLRNDGKIPHEFVIGSMSELLKHAEEMRSMPTMQHAEANMLTLESGGQGDLIWQFDKPGTVDFACLIPGHLEAGMKGSVTVL